MKNLESSNLAFTSLGDEDAVAVAEALPHLTSLKKLFLFHIDVDDAGAMAVAEAVRQMPNLRSLVIYVNKFGEQGEQALRDAWAAQAKACELHWMAQNGMRMMARERPVKTMLAPARRHGPLVSMGMM